MAVVVMQRDDECIFIVCHSISTSEYSSSAETSLRPSRGYNRPQFKFDRDLLKIVAVHKERKNKHIQGGTDSFLCI